MPRPSALVLLRAIIEAANAGAAHDRLTEIGSPPFLPVRRDSVESCAYITADLRSRSITCPMPARLQSSIRTEKLDLRLTASAKLTLQSAAASQGRSLSEFVLRSALEHADEALADRRVFVLDADARARFNDALDAPDRMTPRLDRLMSKPNMIEDRS